MTMWAYADESMRAPRPGSPGVYVMAAAVLNTADVDDCRADVRSLSPRPRTRFHWRDEPARRRRQAVSLVAERCPQHVTVAGSPLDPPRQERARRLCLQRLLPELEHLGVTHVWLDARSNCQYLWMGLLRRGDSGSVGGSVRAM